MSGPERMGQKVAKREKGEEKGFDHRTTIKLDAGSRNLKPKGGTKPQVEKLGTREIVSGPRRL